VEHHGQCFFFSSRRRHTISKRDWSSDVCSSDLIFGFQALWSPYFFTYVFALGLLYFLITGPLRHNFGDHAKPTVKQQTMFYVGRSEERRVGKECRYQGWR